METLGQVAQSGDTIDRADFLELLNRYRSKDRSPVPISDSLVRGRQQDFDLIAQEDRAWEAEKGLITQAFNAIDNSALLPPDQREVLARTLADLYEKYSESMNKYFSTRRLPNSVGFRTARAKMELEGQKVQDFIQELNNNGII